MGKPLKSHGQQKLVLSFTACIAFFAVENVLAESTNSPELTADAGVPTDAAAEQALSKRLAELQRLIGRNKLADADHLLEQLDTELASIDASPAVQEAATAVRKSLGNAHLTLARALATSGKLDEAETQRDAAAALGVEADASYEKAVEAGRSKQPGWKGIAWGTSCSEAVSRFSEQGISLREGNDSREGYPEEVTEVASSDSRTPYLEDKYTDVKVYYAEFMAGLNISMYCHDDTFTAVSMRDPFADSSVSGSLNRKAGAVAKVIDASPKGQELSICRSMRGADCVLVYRRHAPSNGTVALSTKTGRMLRVTFIDARELKSLTDFYRAKYKEHKEADAELERQERLTRDRLLK